MSHLGWNSGARRSRCSGRCLISSRRYAGTSAAARRCASGMRAAGSLAGCCCGLRRMRRSCGWPFGHRLVARASGMRWSPRRCAGARRRATYWSTPSARTTSTATRPAGSMSPLASCLVSIFRTALRVALVSGSGSGARNVAWAARPGSRSGRSRCWPLRWPPAGTLLMSRGEHMPDGNDQNEKV